MHLFYPSEGNFIAFVSNVWSWRLLLTSLKAFRLSTELTAHGLLLPEFITGVSASDQWSFWKEGYPALMVTDTAFFRNPHYHRATDTADTVNFAAMTRVVSGLADVVQRLAK